MKESDKKNVSVFGLGYVGCVSLACIAKAGHCVIGVDVKEPKVLQIQDGVPTIFEPGLDDLMGEAHSQGTISATSDVEHAVMNTTVSLVTVGTPSMLDGELDLSYIYRVSEEIGQALSKVDRYHTIAIRSTVKPGTCNKVAEIIALHSGKQAHKDFSVVANPEFLREGSAIKDYLKPPYVLIGADDVREADEIASVYSDVDAETIRVSLATAEIIKYVNNSWHALKVSFGNEVGSICKTLNIDSQEVMDIFIRDRALNISANYLRPGFAFGGSCLPKDLSGFMAIAGTTEVKVPLLESIKASNDQHLNRAIELIKAQGTKKISFFGLTFKEGTDDLRNSPSLRVVEELKLDGYDIRVLDNDVNSSLDSGINMGSTTLILGDVVNQLVATPEELLEHSKVLVVAKNDLACKQIINAFDVKLIDLVFLGSEFKSKTGYVGLAW